MGRNDDRFGIIRFSEKEWEDLENTLSEESFVQIKRYSYKNKADNLYWLNLDDTRFINHSENPNIATVGDADIALRNIEKGEEILIDYRTFYDERYLIEIMGL